MSRPTSDEDGVLASALELVEIEAVARAMASGALGDFTAAEVAYARRKSDPERRLAARLAAKRATRRLLGDDLGLAEIEVVRGEYGPPELRLSQRVRERLSAVGASRALVSLTHERRHAAALVLLLGDA